MVFLDFLLVVLVELCCFLMTSGFPVDLLCQGRTQNGQIYYKVSPNITEIIHDCDIQWLVNGTVMALPNDKGNTKFSSPIQHATVTTAIMEVGSASDKVEYFFDCIDITVQRRLTCFLQAYPTTQDLLTKNETFAGLTKDGYPEWWIIGVIVAAGVVLLLVVFLIKAFLYKKFQNNPDYVPANQ